MPKLDRAHKNCLTPEIWDETHLSEIFYGNKVVWFVLASMLEGKSMPFNMVANTNDTTLLKNQSGIKYLP